MSQKSNFMTSALADEPDKWWVMNSSPHYCCSLRLRPPLLCPSVRGFALTDLSLSFFFPLPFFMTLIIFTWWLFTCLTHSGQSVLPPCIVLHQFVEFTIYFARAPVSSLFLICLVDLVAHFGLCALASTDSRFWPSAGLLNCKPKLFFSTWDNLMSYIRRSSHLF